MFTLILKNYSCIFTNQQTKKTGPALLMKINSHRLKVEYSDKQFRKDHHSCNNDDHKNTITYHSTTIQYVKFQVKS